MYPACMHAKLVHIFSNRDNSKCFIMFKRHFKCEYMLFFTWLSTFNTTLSQHHPIFHPDPLLCLCDTSNAESKRCQKDSIYFDSSLFIKERLSQLSYDKDSPACLQTSLD
ncbi:hypothetical protein OIU78_008654 [Salix suchowensis]|nr:hypothetical protein OIU78_008654 [Salix suchowensis]